MRKHRLFALILATVLLFAPTVILIVRGASIGRFPKADEVESIEITAEGGSKTVLPQSDPLFDVFFEVLSDSERITASDLPGDCLRFDVMLHRSDFTEGIRLYVSETDCSLYIKNSENRFFVFRDPELDILDTLLTPCKIELCERGEVEPILSYPGNEQPIPDIKLSRWEKLQEIVSTREFSSSAFHLYEKGSDGGYAFVSEVTDASSLADAPSDAVVVYVVRWDLFRDVDLLHYYFFSLGTN
jgi:hypothetical protein